ncbi:hypothetical protein C2G38_2045393 [Gigaspora rosea]|uniref:Uncharacterized protein n=1 Tax=Gigaspora rosea TaxID=44941 RepID=A0A397UDD0_9GLOM|nr:hypothetical protein C2G38_2045393 [Gigaspora rosea]
MKRLFYFLVTIALVLMIAIESGGWVKGQGKSTITETVTTTVFITGEPGATGSLSTTPTHTSTTPTTPSLTGTATTTQLSATLSTTTHTGGTESPTNGPTNGPSPTSGASNVYGSFSAMIGIVAFLMGWI